MTTDEALEFLSRNQPMKPTKDLTDSELEIYDNIRCYFMEIIDERCIPLFLNSFGEGDAHGVYQLISDVLTQFPKETVLEHLLKSLSSDTQSIRIWSAEMALDFPDEKLVPSLSELLSEEDEDAKLAAISALSLINSEKAKKLLIDYSEKETDPYVRSRILSVVEDMP